MKSPSESLGWEILQKKKKKKREGSNGFFYWFKFSTWVSVCFGLFGLGMALEYEL